MRNVTPQPYQPPRSMFGGAAAANRTSTDDLLQEYGIDFRSEFSKLATATAAPTRPTTLPQPTNQPALLLPTATGAKPASGGQPNFGKFFRCSDMFIKPMRA